MDVSEAIRTKHAVRSFEDKPLPEDVVRAILNAGRLAQSAKNMQPWQFVAIQDKKALDKFSKHGHYADHLAGIEFPAFVVREVNQGEGES